MSEKHPECPLYNPLNCKEYYNPKLCAFVRKDKACLKKKKPKPKKQMVKISVTVHGLQLTVDQNIKAKG